MIFNLILSFVLERLSIFDRYDRAESFEDEEEVRE